jgi:hypothetical protein
MSLLLSTTHGGVLAKHGATAFDKADIYLFTEGLGGDG